MLFACVTHIYGLKMLKESKVSKYDHIIKWSMAVERQQLLVNVASYVFDRLFSDALVRKPGSQIYQLCEWFPGNDLIPKTE